MKKISFSLALILLANLSYAQSGDFPAYPMLAGGDMHVGIHISSWEDDTWEMSGDIMVRDDRPGAGMEREPGRGHYALEATGQLLMAELEKLKTPEVGLLRFTAAAHAGELAVEWTSVPAQPVNYFLVQRSQNKKQWQDLGIILAPRNMGPVTSYRYIDPYPHKGTSYYRLGQAGTRSGIAQSEGIAVEMMENGYHVLHMYPHAAIFGANLSLHLLSAAAVDITIEDAAGVEVGKVYSANTRAGTHSIDIDMSALPRGAYSCVIRVEDSVAVRGLVK